MAIVFKTPKTTLNTTTKAIQNLGGDCPPCPEPVLESTELEYTQNGEYTVTPEEGVDGFSSIDVTVNVPSDVNNQNKTVSPSTSSQSVSADSGYSGLGTVTVNAVTAAIDPNIQAANILSGVTILGVTGTDEGYDTGYTDGETAGHSAGYAEGEAAGEIAGAAAQKALLTSTTITQNGTTTREDGWNSVTVNVQPVLQAKTATPTTSQQVITPDQGNYGLSSVTVSGVTNAIDANIQAGNIKSGVTILGVQGTVVEGITPTGNINITDTNSTDVTNYATAQVVDANLVAGNIKNGVTILGVSGSYQPVCPTPNLDTLNVTPTTSAQTIIPTSPVDGYDEVVVSAVTSSIDANIAAGNIKKDVTILGVTGTYEGSGGTQCPDWSSIGWDCNDVAASGITSDLAVTAALLENYDPDTPIANAQYWSNHNDLVYAPNVVVREASSIPSTSVSGWYAGNRHLRYIVTPIKFQGFAQGGTYNNPHCSNLFSYCTSLPSITLDLSTDDPNSTGYVTGANDMFNTCSSLKSATLTNTTGIVNCYNMFKDCLALTSVSLDDTSNVTNTSYMFYNCKVLTTAPAMNTSNVQTAQYMFQGAAELVSVPLYSFGNVTNISTLFGNSSSNMCKKLTTLAGFTNLGKAFVSTDAASNHLLNFQYNTVLTKQSIMNVINNLSAPDDATCMDATLKLSATCYALLDASDIAVATAKNWSVVSA